jgi:hypothetical protein
LESSFIFLNCKSLSPFINSIFVFLFFFLTSSQRFFLGSKKFAYTRLNRLYRALYEVLLLFDTY